MEEPRTQGFQRYTPTRSQDRILTLLETYPTRSFTASQIQAAVLGLGYDIPIGQVRNILQALFNAGLIERMQSGHIFRYRISNHGDHLIEINSVRSSH